MYKGGGYTFTFKRNLEDTKKLLEELEQYEWVDVRARALFIEFTLYNANVNLFASCIFLVEFMSTGSAITRAEVKVRSFQDIQLRQCLITDSCPQWQLLPCMGAKSCTHVHTFGTF